MTSKNEFAKFDKFKNEVETLLEKIKNTQNQLKDSLQEDKNKKILLKEAYDIQKNVNDFKEQFKSNIEQNIQEIIDKIKYSNIESTEELEYLKNIVSKSASNIIHKQSSN